MAGITSVLWKQEEADNILRRKKMKISDRTVSIYVMYDPHMPMMETKSQGKGCCWFNFTQTVCFGHWDGNAQFKIDGIQFDFLLVMQFD